ncbi:hypothetical protein DVH24_020326 [Malus domestica]|uniref:Pre-mRNA-splicing factor Syf1-like N-terminal HAT-repeats domain-containing protein n=1 Tax=Malus domestica TaxID=3750 RepID=A0A498JBX6_MALDO|nr:hypothetical protein DVH24_020326 [Malus domestica]
MAKDSNGYKDTDDKLPQAKRVKNKSPAPVQITAEQLLREAREGQEGEFRPPQQQINDATELADFRLRMRKGFEDQVRRQKQNARVWIKYARWEESQKELDLARSVWERLLEVDYRNHTVWVEYAGMEMKNKMINHARNVWERAVQLLPSVDQLWYKYIHMEEMIGNVARARGIFRRWMDWMPDQQGWIKFIEFELRYNEVYQARAIFEQFVQCHPKADAWIRYAKFEMKNGDVARLGRDRIPKGKADSLYRMFEEFEERYGDRQGIEDAIVNKARFKYEQEVRKNHLDYDAWFGYTRLEENAGNKEKIRQVYDRAIANVPPAQEKRYWQRYIYLWINYALYEEIDARDEDHARAVYRMCLELIPHKKFTFAKMWILAAEFEIRQLKLESARKILGTAIGKAAKGKIFKRYIEIEWQLRNADRCRKLYEKYLHWSPENSYAWISYAEFEEKNCDAERARSVYELAISQKQLDKPELLWKSYIDFELAEREFERARDLYGRLLERTQHVKVWISYAAFEASAMVGGDGMRSEDVIEQKEQCIQRARRVFERASDYFRTSAPELKEQRSMLLEQWRNTEEEFGDFGDVTLVQAKLPRRLKRKRPIVVEDGGSAGFEEYIDYLFPEEALNTNWKLFEAVYHWKRRKDSSAEDGEDKET